MKTAMQEWNEALLKRLSTINSEPNGIVREAMIDNILVGHEMHLEYEKQQIMDAVMSGNTGFIMPADLKIAAENYYNETFQSLS